MVAALAGAFILAKLSIFSPVGVKVTRLESRDLTAQVYGNGTVEAKVVVGISSKITGKIVEIHARGRTAESPCRFSWVVGQQFR